LAWLSCGSPEVAEHYTQVMVYEICSCCEWYC